MSIIIESGYIGDKDYFLIECEHCETHFKTQDDTNCFCSKKCYKDAKFEYEQD